jgi:hypothetical protein
MNQEHILSNESKVAVRSKMADQNQIFWRNIFTIFFLHSLGLSKMQILWKKSFSKNPRWRLQHFFSFQQPSWIFWKTFFPQNLRLTKTLWMQKEDCKNVGYSQSYVKKYNFDPPFWIEPPLLTHLTRYALDSCCWQIYKRIVKNRT